LQVESLIKDLRKLVSVDQWINGDVNVAATAESVGFTGKIVVVE
jgi:hypothetical protein